MSFDDIMDGAFDALDSTDDELDGFDALLYAAFPEDEEEETDPILERFMQDMNNIERIGTLMMNARTTNGMWFLDCETGEYRQMSISSEHARKPEVMRLVSLFEGGVLT